MHPLIKRVISWSEKAGIFKNSSFARQEICFLEELHELQDAIKSGDESKIKDELGDCLVVLINMDQFSFKEISCFYDHLYSTPTFKILRKKIFNDDKANLGFSVLCSLALKELKVNPEECLEIAVRKIEKRKGMIFDKGGKFIKFESMTDEQKEIFKKKERENA